VQRGKPAVVEERPLDELWHRRVPAIAEESSFDPTRDKGSLPERSGIKQRLSWEAFLVGPVLVRYGGDPARSTAVDIDRYVDRKAKTIRSITGEISFDHANGVCVLDSPCAQGAAAFFDKKPTIRTKALTIESRTSYGVVLAVSLDGKPLDTSAKVLVQMGTDCRPAGWKEISQTVKVREGSYPGFKLESVGKAPWQLVRADVKLTLANSGLRKATVVDPAGKARGEVKLERGKAVSFRFPPDALYVVLE
jgi:hypothetical protein